MYTSIINFIDTKEVELVYVDEKDVLLKEILTEKGYYQTREFEEDLLVNDSILLNNKLVVNDAHYTIRNVKIDDINNQAVMISQAFDNYAMNPKLVVKNYKYLYRSIVFDSKTQFVMFDGDNIVSYCGFWPNKDKQYAIIEPVVTKKET